MASAEFLEQALFKDVDENAVNAIVGSLENQLVTSVSSGPSTSSSVNNISNQYSSNTSSANSPGGIQKYNANSSGTINFIQTGGNNVQSIATSSFVPQSLSNSTNEPIKVYSQSQTLCNPLNGVNFPIHSLANSVIGLSSANQIIHTVPTSAIPSGNKITMQPPLVIKQGTTSGQVGIQSGMVTVPMTVNSSMPNSIPNVMTINKPGQNVVVTTQNIGSGQPTIIPNVQILNMRPGAPTVAAQKSVATVSPRVVIGTPQVVGARAAAPGITLQTLQSLQPGQQGHLLLKTENGQYQLLRVGPAPAASTLAAPQAQTIRLSTVPAHPGVATVSTSIAAPGQMASQVPSGPVPTPVVASGAPIASAAPSSVPPTVTTQKPSDNTKEKCRNFLANLLELSSKEPEIVERNVRSLIQELIDAQVEPGEFCDRLERLLNASPQPCLIGFLEKSLPLLRQSLVTKELTIEGINPPPAHVAFSNIPAPTQPSIVTSNVQMLSEEDWASPFLPPMVSVPMSDTFLPTPKPNISPAQAIPVQLSSDGDWIKPTFAPFVPSMMAVSSPQYLPPPMEEYTSQLSEEDWASPFLPPMVSVPMSDTFLPTPKPNISPAQAIPVQHKPVHKAGTIAVLQNIPVQTKINVSKVSAGKAMASLGNKGNFSRPGMPPSAALSTVLTPSKSLLKEKEKKVVQYSQAFDDKMAADDDINDVAAMGGVNLAEETQRILGSTEMIGTQIRSCKDEYLIPMGLMQSRIKAHAAKHGLDEPSIEVAGLISHAVHERLKTIVEKLAVIAQHRIDLIIKTDSRYEITQDVKGQLKFLEELDRVDKKRREDSERELLLRAAKSRSKNEDPEQAKLKAKAKEMQRAELEELRQREANLTALQAIGPRKKPRLEGPGGAGDAVPAGPQPTSAFTGRSQLALRTRLKRINHRDMVFLLEQEKDTAHSSMLFRSYLK